MPWALSYHPGPSEPEEAGLRTQDSGISEKLTTKNQQPKTAFLFLAKALRFYRFERLLDR
jgi:hypothetical protein